MMRHPKFSIQTGRPYLQWLRIAQINKKNCQTSFDDVWGIYDLHLMRASLAAQQRAECFICQAMAAHKTDLLQVSEAQRCASYQPVDLHNMPVMKMRITPAQWR